MSSEKKVVYLFLLLIVFISACVYKHLPDFLPAENNETQTIQEKSIEEEPIKVDETKNSVEETVVQNEQDTQKEESLSQTESNLENKNLQEEVVNPEAQEPSVEEKIEEVREPLITTNEKYIREGDEKKIEEMSFETQELQLKINEFVKKNPIEFQRGSYKFTNKSVKTIEEVAKYLNEYPSIKMEIAGHTDFAGEEKVNEYYSLERAKSVQKKLIELGIASDRLVVRGYGESIPLVENGYLKINRRVEFNIIEE